MPEFFSHNRYLLPRRAFIVVPLLWPAFGSSEYAAQSKTRSKRILFVCQAGTAKSAIAREMFKRRSRERGIPADVFSRGIKVEDHISPKLRQKLLDDGMDTTAEPAMPLGPADWTAADILVNFNPLPASVKHKDVRDWSNLPSVNDDYVNARAILKQRIDALLTEIDNSKR